MNFPGLQTQREVSMFKRQILPFIAFLFYKSLQLTWKIKIVEAPLVQQWRKKGQPFLIAHWHGDELGILHLLKEYHVACIISTSADGDIMNKAVKLLGGETVRGSSTRGGVGALKGIIGLKNKGWNPSVAVDGPKGPIYEVKPGIFQISRLAKLPIVPISYHASRFKIFEKSWNKTRLPLPFSTVVIEWGEPLPMVSKDIDPKSPELAEQLKNTINRVKKNCEERIT